MGDGAQRATYFLSGRRRPREACKLPFVQEAQVFVAVRIVVDDGKMPTVGAMHVGNSFAHGFKVRRPPVGLILWVRPREQILAKRLQKFLQALAKTFAFKKLVSTPTP